MTISSWKDLWNLHTLNKYSNQYRTAKISLNEARKQKSNAQLWRQTIEKYEEYVKGMKIDSIAFCQLAECYEHTKEFVKAIENYKKALRRKETRPKFLLSSQSLIKTKLAECYFELGFNFISAEYFVEILQYDDKAELAEKNLKKIYPRLTQKERSEIEKQINEKVRNDFDFEDSIENIEDTRIGKIIKSRESLSEVRTEYVQKVIMYLDIFEGALESHIRVDILSNAITTRNILQNLINDGIVREIKLRGNTSFYNLTDSGKIQAKDLYHIISESDVERKEKIDENYILSKETREKMKSFWVLKGMDLLEFQKDKKNVEKIRDKIKSEMKKRELKHLITIETEIIQEVMKEENLKNK